jgi:hypothetical protein
MSFLQNVRDAPCHYTKIAGGHPYFNFASITTIAHNLEISSLDGVLGAYWSILEQVDAEMWVMHGVSLTEQHP